MHRQNFNMLVKSGRFLTVLLITTCLHAGWVLSASMVLTATRNDMFIPRQQTTLTCEWVDDTLTLPDTSHPPFAWSRTEGYGKYETYPLTVSEAAVRVNGSAYRSSYTFTVQRQDHFAIFKCLVQVPGRDKIQKFLTVFIRSGPATPIIEGPTTLMVGQKGQWTCTSDCATHEYPFVTIIYNHQTLLKDCPKCRSVNLSTYVDEYNLKTYKVVLTATLILDTLQAGDTYKFLCSSVYKPFTAFLKTKYSNLLQGLMTLSRETDGGEERVIEDTEEESGDADEKGGIGKKTSKKKAKAQSSEDSNMTLYIALSVACVSLTIASLAVCFGGVRRRHRNENPNRALGLQSGQQNGMGMGLQHGQGNMMVSRGPADMPDSMQSLVVNLDNMTPGTSQSQVDDQSQHAESVVSSSGQSAASSDGQSVDSEDDAAPSVTASNFTDSDVD